MVTATPTQQDIKAIQERKAETYRNMIVYPKGHSKEGEPMDPPPKSYWQYMGQMIPPFRMGKPQRPLCWRIGFNGPPGGGKSVSCAWMTGAQFLLRGIPVFTIPDTYYIRILIEWENKQYYFVSQPLDLDRLIMFDPALQGTCVVADEANLQLADSHRSMSNKNLGVSDYVQQARHHGVSMLYTCILPNWIDPRLRQLTDVLIYCTDNAFSAAGEEAGLDIGEWTTWTLTDQSGQLSGVPFEVEPNYYTWNIHLKDYWGITDSFNVADSIAARQNIKFHDKARVIGMPEIEESPQAENIRNMALTLQDVINRYANSEKAIPDSRDRILVPVVDFWRMVGGQIDIADRLTAQRILTNTMGIKYVERASGNCFDITNFIEAGAVS